MATYEELLDFANNYNPQQQQLGDNFYAQQNGMVQQEETPYQKMMRETYGAPAQTPQEEPGLLGSITNRFSGQQPTANTDRGWLDDISDTAAGINATRILTEQQREADNLLWKYHYDKSLTDEQRQEIKAEYDRRKQELDKTAAEVQRARKALQQSPNLLGNAGSHVLSAGSSLESMQEQYKYNLLGAGAGFLVGGPLGAAAGWKLANVPSAVLVNYRDAEAGAMDAWHEVMEKTGNKELAEQAYWEAMKPNLAYAALATIPDVMIGQGVGKGAVNFGKRMLGIGGKEIAEEAAEKAAKGAAGKLKKAADAVDLDFADKAGNWVAAKTGLPMLGTAANIGARMTPEVLSEMGQEAEQGIATNAAVATAMHQYDPNANPDEGGWSRQRVLDWLNSEEGKETLLDTAASTALTAGMASAVGSIGSVVSGKRGNGQFDEFGNPNAKFNNQVTNNEFPDAVAVAKHDTSTNLVDRMRNLEGRIGYNASDGTNCARTIGLALAGTPYQDQINVDNFVAIAKEQGQLKDPNSYVPKPGDLAVVNNGNHIVMVSENGGTIQNGSSANGVYESAQSPLQMFGAVKYYISTSELSSGDYGVAGNLRGGNEQQRQEEYYQNLIAQETQRRADAIREVLGAKTHEQEQQEQAVLDAQKYQQENASEIAPINNYYDAFTEQELNALSPQEKQTLKDNFDAFYGKKQNWSHTAAEKVQVARGMYNQLLGNRQQTPTVNNVRQQAAAPVVNQTVQPAATQQAQQQVAPVAQENAQQNAAPTTASTTNQQAPVVQQQAKQTTEEISPDEWEKRLQKATEDVAEAYRNGDITKDEYERRMQEIDDAYDTNVTQKRGVTQYTPADDGAMARQAAEQKAIDENVAKGNRVKFQGMLNDLYKKRKNGQTEEDKQLIASQVNAASKTGLAMLDKGATAEDAFNAVKDSIGTEKQKAKAKADAEKQAKKEGKKNGTSQKSEELSQPETGENRDNNPNAESQKVEQQKGENSKSAESENKVEVTQNADNESTVSKVSEGEQSGTVSENAGRRQTKSVSGNETGSGEKVSGTNDENVRAGEPDQSGQPGESRGLSEQPANVGGRTNEQAAVRRGLPENTAESQKEQLDKINKSVENNDTTIEKAREATQKAQEGLDKTLDNAEVEAESKTTAEGDPALRPSAAREAYEKYFKDVVVKVGNESYKLVIDKGNDGKDVIRWATTNGKVVEGTDNPLKALLWEAVKETDGKLPTLDDIIESLENKRDTGALSPNFRDALELAQKMKEDGMEFSATKTRSDNTTKYSASVEEASNAENGQELKRSLDDLITEAKKAFKGATKFRINRDDLIFTMPNGLEMKVNIKDQIILSAEEEAKARKEHGLSDDERVIVEGYAKALDKGSLVVLSKEGQKGTTFHETFHTVWNWVLTEKEKAAMLKHFTPIAEKLGIDVEEAMADGYRDWLLARQQHKGTIFGKLYQKVLDFVNGALKVLTGAESVHNIYQQIAEGKVWNRDAKGRFATEENAVNGEKKFLVTNKKITADTQVPVVDVTNIAEAGASDAVIRKNLADALIGKEFKVLGSDAIGFTKKTDNNRIDGRRKADKPAEHLFRGDGNPNAKDKTNPVRQKALAAIDDVLDNAIYIEKGPDMDHDSNIRYVTLFAAVRNGKDVYPIRIQAREKDKGSGIFTAGKPMYYNLSKKGALPQSLAIQKLMASTTGSTPTISVAELLQNVKDKAGRPYVVNGQLQYDPAALSALTGGKASISVRKPTAVNATEDALTEELLVTVDTLKERTPQAHAKNIEALRTNEGFNVPATETDKASEQIISRMEENILYLFNKMPKQLRERAKKWYDGGRRMAEEWSKRYGLSPQTISGVVAILSPQKGWFENVSLAERLLDCAYGRANSRWASAMDNTYTFNKDEAKKTGKIFIDEKNKAALERAKHRPKSKVRPTLGELLSAGDYKAAAIWIRCFDKAFNEPYYRTITPEGATGDYVFNDDGVTKTKIRWQTLASIEKALAVAMNPSHTTIFNNIGEKHKVPNFFNNINEPKDPRYVTVDTHAVSAAAMQPFSTESKAVKQNFGGTLGAAGSAVTGIKGTYPYYQEAYTRVAKKVGMLPREVQSIVWEVVRNVFPDKIKDTKSDSESRQQRAIREIWRRADEAIKAAGENEQKVKKILANARKFAYNIGTENGKLNPFAWENAPADAPLGETYDRKKVAPPSFGDEDVAGVMVEVAPDPNDKEATARFNKLTAEQKAEVSKEVINFVVPLVMKEYGVDKGSYKIVEQIGGYKGATNPSFRLEIPPQLALPIAKNLGYLLNQDSMAIVSDKPVRGTTPARMISLALPKSWGMAEVSRLYNKLYEIENNPDENGNATRAIDGHSTLDGSMEILNFSDYSNDVLAEKIREKIKDTIPNAEIESFKVYSALIEKADYGYKKEGAEGNGIVDRRTNNIQSQVAEKLERAISKAEGQGLSKTADGVGQGNRPGTQEAEKSKTERLLGQEEEGTGVVGDDETGIKTSIRLYNEAAEKYPQIKEPGVSNLVKDGIRQTVDFGKREGDILDSASGNHVRQGVSGLRTSTRPALHSLGEQVGGMPVYSEKGFGLTRELINEGVVDLTGRKVNSISDLAEIAQVLRHPGYEKLHYVYVKDGKIVYHETTTTGLPATAKAQLKGEKRRDYEARMRENLRRTGADALYLLHNHPDGDVKPSQSDFELTDFHKGYTAPSGVTFGGHIILDTTECNVLTGGKNESRLSIPENAQIHYDAKADVPNILLGSKLGPTQALVDISKKLADQSTTTVFFTDTSDKVRSIIQLPSEFMQMDERQMMRYLRWAAKKEFGTWAYIVTSDQDAYKKMLPLYRQGSGVYDILLTSNPETAKGQGQYRYSGKFNAYDYFGIESDASSAHKVLGEGVNKEQVQGTQEGASSTSKYSIRQDNTELAKQKEAVRKQLKGTDKWMKAPNGKPTNLTEDQWVTTQTPQFKEWFGDSKVVDENGEPLVVYHGSPNEFDAFDKSKVGEKYGAVADLGFYFTNDKFMAQNYQDISGTVYSTFLNLKNPLIVNGEGWGSAIAQADKRHTDLKRWAEEQNADGIIVTSTDEILEDDNGREYQDAVYIAFEPNQIKDASGNNVSITKDSDNIHYSITSAAGKALDKVEAYVNRNNRTPNENTATGRASKAFNNTQNKNRAQTFTEWLKDRFNKFYREWIDKNDAIHNVDDEIEKITGKKLAEEDKVYNMVQGARAYAQGAADTLVQGTKEAFESLKEALGRGINPNDTKAMDRLKELKKDFKYATVQQALEPIMKKDMDQKYPYYLEKHGINNWHDAFSNYLGARRILELIRLIEDKSLQYITHDKKEFTDFIDRHPEYEAFRPKPFAKGSWREQVQKIAQAEPKLAEQMAKELAKEYKLPNGVTREDLEALVKEAPKEFDKSAQIYYQLQRNLLTMMELGHLIPADVHDKINSMYKEYCPLMIDYSDTAGLDTAIAQFGRGADSIANVDSMLKHVLQLGSERGLISPLESTYKSIQALTNRAERNKVAVHFVKTVANSPELQKSGILKQVPGSSADAKNCIFTVLINGKKVAFQTTQDLYGPIVGYDMPAAGIVEGFCRSSAQLLRYGATTSPSFIIRNFIRDTIFAGVSSRNGFVPVLDSFRGMMAYLHNKELRGEFDAMGITAYNYFGSGESAVKSMEELMGEKDWAYLKAHPTELIKELIKYIPKKFAAASEVVEASTRMGEYMKARQKGKSMQEAALDARDVTLDFSRSGFYGQRVNMMVPFFNACIQGGDKMFNRMLFSKDPKVRAQTVRMLGLYILLPSVALWFMHKDEPWYEELDPRIKMNNWIIGKFRIPKPQEAGIAFGSGIEAILDKIYNKDPKAGKEWVEAMREVLVPNLIPTVGLPMLEWMTNYSLFREKPLESNRLKRLPVEMRYNAGTTEISKALSKAIGGAYGASPVKLDNTIRGYTGTLGMLMAQIPDIYFESERNLPSKPMTERAMVRDFFINDMNLNRTSEDFYNLVNAAQQQHAGYGKKGHPTPDVKAINKALRDVSKQQKEIQEITNAKGISQDRKRQMIDRKRNVIKTIQKATLKRYGNKYDI